MNELKSRNGFTLVELLIVITIIAVLVTISIPTFSMQLEGARTAVDMSNARAASSLAYSEYILYHYDDMDETKSITYTFGTDDEFNLFIMSHSAEGGSEIDDGNNESRGETLMPKSKKLKGIELKVVVKDGKISENSWLEAFKEP